MIRLTSLRCNRLDETLQEVSTKVKLVVAKYVNVVLHEPLGYAIVNRLGAVLGRGRGAIQRWTGQKAIACVNGEDAVAL